VWRLKSLRGLKISCCTHEVIWRECGGLATQRVVVGFDNWCREVIESEKIWCWRCRIWRKSRFMLRVVGVWCDVVVFWLFRDNDLMDTRKRNTNMKIWDLFGKRCYSWYKFFFRLFNFKMWEGKKIIPFH